MVVEVLTRIRKLDKIVNDEKQRSPNSGLGLQSTLSVAARLVLPVGYPEHEESGELLRLWVYELLL